MVPVLPHDQVSLVPVLPLVGMIPLVPAVPVVPAVHGSPGFYGSCGSSVSLCFHGSLWILKFLQLTSFPVLLWNTI